MRHVVLFLICEPIPMTLPVFLLTATWIDFWPLGAGRRCLSYLEIRLDLPPKGPITKAILLNF
jgi:hypothetical protein